MSLIRRSYSDGHKRSIEIITRVDPEKQKLPRTTCEWCTSVIRCTLEDLHINRHKVVVFQCPVCNEYSRTDCASLEKVKWYQRRNVAPPLPKSNDFFPLPENDI